MELKKLKFFLESQGETHELKQSPSGWEDTLVEYLKSNQYYGMLRNMTVPLEFVTNGATILKRDFYTRATGAQTWLIIEELNPSTTQYERKFRGKIDYSKFKDLVARVTVNVMEEGITEFVKAYEKVTYEIPLSVPTGVTIELPGIGVTEVADAIYEPIRNTLEPLGISENRKFFIGTDIVLNELNSGALIIQSQVNEIYNSPAELLISSNWFVEATEDTNLNVRIKIKGKYGAFNNGSYVRLVIKNQDNINVATVRNFIGKTVGSQFIAFELDDTVIYNISLGERLFFVLEAVGNSGGFMEVDEGSYEITNNLITTPSPVLALTAYEVFKQLIQKMGGVSTQVESRLLRTEWKRLKITSGDAIRGLDNPVIKTSFSEFYDAVNALLSVGFGVESGVAVLEKKDYFNRPNTVLDLGEVTNPSITPAPNHLFSYIRAGYADNEYESEYGREEYNSGQIWSLPNTRVQKELNIVSPYRADQLGIEEIRTTPAAENANLTDRESDNDTFFIVTKEEPREDGLYEVEGAEAYRSPDGIKGLSARNSYYNLSISPKKNLLRHGGYLRSSLYGITDRNVLFQSADKNAALVTTDLNGNTVVERLSIPISSLAPAYFVPMLASFETDLPIDAITLLDAGIYGRVRFTIRGVELFGFIEKAGVNMPRNSSQTWTVLLGVNSNLSGLIR